MRYVLDHDFHIHTQFSPCSGNPEQTPQRILSYAKENGLRTVIITDHYWDERIPTETSHGNLTTEQIKAWGALPEADGIRILYGAEADIDYNGVLGVNRRTCDDFDFVLISATHMHMDGFTCRGDEDLKERIDLYIRRLEIILNADIPHEKIGFTHPVTPLIYPVEDRFCEVLDGIPDAELRRLLGRAAELGMGIEINISSTRDYYDPNYNIERRIPSMLRFYRIAKEAGCKFFFGSDAHSPGDFGFYKPMAEQMIDQLGLEESDKFILK